MIVVSILSILESGFKSTKETDYFNAEMLECRYAGMQNFNAGI